MPQACSPTIRNSIVCMCLLAGACTLAFAQSETAIISGRVTDPQEKLIIGATIKAVNTDTNIVSSAVTNPAGVYVIPALKPGSYRLSVRADGFREVVKTDIVLHVQDVLAQNFTLQLGSVEESITVVADQNNINMTDGSVSTVVDRRFVENLPMNGRSFQTLIMLTPGVVLTPSNGSNQGQFSINGQRPDANYLTVDGVSANISINVASLQQTAGGAVPGFNLLGGTNSLVSVDAMQEFRIQTSSFAPEFGRTPGGQIMIGTRSGTNQFRGTVFDYLRNNVLDANDWFSNRSGLRKPQDRQNDFGGVVGGPIIKSRTFFFLSYEGLRLRQPLSAVTAVPSTASPNPALDRQAAPAAVQPFLNAFPIPNGPDLGNGFARFSASYSNPSSLDTYSLRIDHALTPRMNLFARYNYSPNSTATRSFVLSSLSDLKTTTYTFTLGLDRALSARMTNELRANYSNVKSENGLALDSFGGAVPISDSLAFPPGFTHQNSQFALQLNGSGSNGFGNINLGKVATNEQRQINVLDNLSVVLGTHHLKLGVDYRWLAPIAGSAGYQGLFVFSGMVGATGALAGVVQLAQINSRQPVAMLDQNFSLYLQDTWKMTGRLTATYGLRWDVNPALTGKNSASDPLGLQGDPANPMLAAHGTALYPTTWSNVAPRVGLAYQVGQRAGWETVLRGGFGRFYDMGSGWIGTYAGGFPFTASKTLASVPFPLSPQQAAPLVPSSALPTGTQFWTADPNLRLPRTYQWSATLEQSLGASQALSVAYVGAGGRDLLRFNSLRGPNANFTSFVFVTEDTGESEYNALQLKFQRRLGRGLQALASYTWSHATDDASSDAASGLFPGRIEWGNSDFDLRHSFTAALTYDLPAPEASRLVHALLGNWSVDDLFIAQSALPVNVTSPSVAVSGISLTPRPNVVSGIPLYLYGAQYPGGRAINFTPNQGGAGCKGPFCNPPAGEEGNLGRNSLRGFGTWQTNFAIRRQFHLTERIGLQLRAEFFNLFNHPAFGPPTSTLSSPLFGQSTGTLASSLGSIPGVGGVNPLYQVGGPRSIQLATKVIF